MSRIRTELLHIPSAGGTPRIAGRKRAVVVGGGIAGVAAATVLCERGVEVTLIEREVLLGGRAGGFSHRLQSGDVLQMERGFHAFFRQYYNLRSLLQRIDPTLSLLQPLPDYPILGPSGMLQSFRGLPKRTPFQVMKLTWQTPYLSMRDLMRVDGLAALEMLRFAPERTYERYDAMTAEAYLSSLRFPDAARRMLFDVFSHSFFNPEAELSAAELLMSFHFYFTGNAEGLIFDVVKQPLPAAIWRPFEDWLRGRGVRVITGSAVSHVSRTDAGTLRIEHAGEPIEADDLVIALDVRGLQQLVAASPTLAALTGVQQLQLTRPFAVLRLWLEQPLAPERAAFAGTTGVGLLDNISCYERFQDESAAWAAKHGGSVVELHAYAVPPELDEAAIRADLIAGLHAFYPETRGVRVLDECMLLRQDCPAFPPGSMRMRPTPRTALPDVTLAGDFVSVPLPCALMERATVSGFIAANTLLARHGVAPEPIRSVPRQGLLAPLSWKEPQGDSSWSAAG
ncbi:MAG TPA: FAD-dependent oxidoreductase [Polyangiales bacterium]|nr:FAD-dependent oxidoreductase [Polyangiales bacterium]